MLVTTFKSLTTQKKNHPAKTLASKSKKNEEGSRISPVPSIRNKFSGMKISKKSSGAAGPSQTAPTPYVAPVMPKLSASEIHVSRPVLPSKTTTSEVDLNNRYLYQLLDILII